MKNSLGLKSSYDRSNLKKKKKLRGVCFEANKSPFGNVIRDSNLLLLFLKIFDNMSLF